ncbi:MAG: FRG domain-containing protein, partial [Alphaproteobacteria bacterium]|nr:FRG domain-containing protein [Alphaproteobacteria bacterium]
MFKETNVESWTEFSVKVAELQRKVSSDSRWNRRLLFRGHEKSDWQLKTTLERYGQEGMRFREYYRTISSLRPLIEMLTQKQWEIPGYMEIARKADEIDDLDFQLSVQNSDIFQYMAYLRHNGFPSPLLDWTRSLYVASYFAFRSVPGDILNGNVSICVLLEANMQSGGSGIPSIRTIGPYMKTHRRHFLQQSDYTMCLMYNGSERFFARHEV